MLRAARDAGTDVGLEARPYLESGKLVPDEVVWRIAHEALSECGFDDFILDGFPRTIQQADWLDADLDQVGGGFRVVSLEVPSTIIVDRLSKRRIHRHTGEVYHLEYNPPPIGTPEEHLIQRRDDRPDAIEHRLVVYGRETAPIKQHYDARGELIKVDGVGEPAVISQRIITVLEG
jgi:adenylate kinase